QVTGLQDRGDRCPADNQRGQRQRGPDRSGDISSDASSPGHCNSFQREEGTVGETSLGTDEIGSAELCQEGEHPGGAGWVREVSRFGDAGAETVAERLEL